MKKNIFILCFSLFLLACADDSGPEEEVLSPVEQLQKDIEIIDTYLSDNGIVAEQDPSGLRYIINEAGDGEVPVITNTVTVRYEGRLLSDGSVFDSNDDANGVAFPLNRLILGWQIGIPLIAEGGAITLYIPSGFAYGPQGNSSIPGNAILIFDVELLAVK